MRKVKSVEGNPSSLTQAIIFMPRHLQTVKFMKNSSDGWLG